MMFPGATYAPNPVSEPRKPRQAARAVFAHHACEGVRIPVRVGQVGAAKDGTTAADFDAQCAQAFANIGAALQSQGASFANIVEFTTYLVHSQDIPKFMQYRMREFPRLFAGGAYPPNTLLIIDRLVREEFLIEVSAVAAL
jgi:enamine deaminase RidA (YjgF/YER057c/UK114 family)